MGPPGSMVPDTVEATDLLDLVSSLELPECLLIPPRETTPESLPPYKNIDIVLDYPSTDWLNWLALSYPSTDWLN